MKKYKLYNKVLNDKQIIYIINKIKDLEYTKCHKWLGTFDSVTFEKESDDIDKQLFMALHSILGLVFDLKDVNISQDFNTVTIKRLEPEQLISPQVDSRNTVGKSISIVLGNFTTTSSLGGEINSAIYKFDGEKVSVESGDVIIQSCTNKYSMGPQYMMLPIKSGVKYSITICTILEENPV